MAQFSLQQKQQQALAQTLGQRQIQSLSFLAMGSDDLREAIYAQADKNPALEIVRDARTAGVDVRARRSPDGNTRVSSRGGQQAAEASDRFQALLEAKADARTSLSEHLLSQLRVLPLSASQERLGTALIHNLDGRGFHMLAPVSLLDRSDPAQDEALLRQTMRLIQSLDPAGTCTQNSAESLLVQARLKGADDLTLFLLDGHLDFLDPPQPKPLLKKIQAYQKEQAALFGSQPPKYDISQVTERDAGRSIALIKTLDPYPARDFGADQTQYVSPDVYVEPLGSPPEQDDFAGGIVVSPGAAWHVRLSRDAVPQVAVNQELAQAAKDAKAGGQPAGKAGTLSASVQDAEQFVRALALRQGTILAATCLIVKHQAAFFAKGPGNLVPLRQQDIADALGVHETTISRMANSKYVQCQWGLFEIKYFFTGSASRSAQPGGTSVSRDTVLAAMQQILSQDGGTKLSDQKLADALRERGITVARRTVAKYRAQLNIQSSYTRRT